MRVGGLGDVGGSLPYALRSLPAEETGGRTLDVRMVIPLHGVIDPAAFTLREVATFPVPHGQSPIEARAFATEINGLPVYLISGAPFLRGTPVYSLDASLDGPKYAFFSQAALELARQLDWAPDILHANDWHTAPAVYALALKRSADPFFKDTRTVLTVHNLPFMGAGAQSALPEYHIPYSTDDRLPDWAQQLPLPLGLLTADRIVAVSRTYAKEILTPEFGCGLQDFLKTREKSISGILNGIDTQTWDPSHDPNAITNFDRESLALRAANKATLQSRFSMIESQRTPLLVFIGRMDPQKGVDSIINALQQISELDWQAIILGTGVPALEAEARQMENDFPDRVRAAIRFDNQLAHLMYAGADILMMPSRYEPCGLAQMIAMRYGCVPVAHATGGLVDTIQDYTPGRDGTGFLYKETTADALADTLRRAIYTYPDSATWKGLQKRGMQQDFNWRRSAVEYAELYLKVKEETP